VHPIDPLARQIEESGKVVGPTARPGACGADPGNDLARIKLSKVSRADCRGGKGKGRAEGQVPFGCPLVFFGARRKPVRASVEKINQSAMGRIKRNSRMILRP
jgi:hypothetical protein